MKNKYAQLCSIIGGRVHRLELLIWPDGDGLRNTDVRLHLQVTSVDGSSHELTFGTESDGQTLSVEMDHRPPGLPFASLEQRKKVWSSTEFWDEPASRNYELFDVALRRDLNVGKDSIVTAIKLVQFADDPSEVTGIVIEFDTQVQIWSAPSANGNFVSTNPEDFFWPSAIELIPLT